MGGVFGAIITRVCAGAKELTIRLFRRATFRAGFPGSTKRILVPLVVVACALNVGGWAWAADTRFVYDELGRLIQVIPSSGSTTQYAYDAAGNITAVKVDSSSALAITDFSPASAAPGGSVTIFGSGFISPTTANTVKFNGQTATVSAANTNTLQVVVPAGATSGPLSVSNSNGSAASATNFIVDANAPQAAPTLTSFTPSMGPVGTVATLTGSGFQGTASGNRVNFGGAQGAVTAATSATQLTASVPENGSGKVSITTANGTAVSGTDFYVLPSGTIASSVVATQRVVVDGPAAAVNIGTAGAKALLLFEATAGQQLGLGVASMAANPTGSATLTITAYTPMGKVLGSCSVSEAGKCNLPATPQTGTYRLLLAMDSNHSANLSLLLSASTSGQLTSGASPTTFATDRVGQNARYTFSATAGQSLTLNWGGATFVGSWSYITVYAPDGSTLTSQNFSKDSSPSGRLPLNNLQQTGTYTVLVDPYRASTGQVTLQLLAPDSGILTVDGSSLAIDQDAGQSGRYTFNGTAGQRLGLGLSGLVLAPAGGSVSVTVLAPDGSTTLVNCNSFSSDDSCNLPALPSAGTYTAVLTPSNAATAVKGNLTLSNELTGALIDGANPITFTTARVGQNGRYTFNATAGQSLSLNWSGATFVGSWSYITVYAPDGSTLINQNFSNGSYAGGQIQLNNLQRTGTYTVFVDPYRASTGQVALQLLAPDSGTLTVDGSSLAIDQDAGQMGRYTFAGTVGQRLGLGVSGLMLTPAGGYVSVVVMAPGGVTTLVNCSNLYNDDSCNLPALPSTGAYTVVLTPGNAATAVKGNLTLSSDLTGTLVAGADPTAFTTARAGQNGRYTFSATAGQSLSLNWSGATFVGSSSTITVYAPDGSALTSQNFNNGSYASGQFQLNNLQWTGTYTVFVDPYRASTGQVALQLLAPAGGTLAVDGDPLAINQGAGATGRYTFAGTAGQRLGLGVSGLTLTPAGGYVSVTVMAPGGATTLANCSSFSSNGSCNLPVLPSAGIYTVVVTPSNAATAVKGNLTLSNDLTGALVAGADPTIFITARAGQNGRYTFSATAGQSLTLAWGAATIPGTWSYLTVYGPNGNALANPYFGIDSVSGRSQLDNLQQTGTYTVFVDPFQANTGQVSLRLLAPLDNQLAVDGSPLAISQSVGQIGRYTFTGTAGQRLGLGWSELAITPSNGSASIRILNPDNLTTLIDCSSFSQPGSCNLPSLPSTGTYTVVVNPYSSNTSVVGQLTLSQDAIGSIDLGATTTFSTSRVGQNGRYSFNGTAGQTLALAWSGATFAGSSNQMSVYAPDGAMVASGAFGSSNYPGGQFQLNNLPQSGSYTVVIDPSLANTGQVALQLVAAATGVLLTNGPPLLVAQLPGSMGVYTFSGNAGEHLGLGISNFVATPSGATQTTVVYTSNFTSGSTTTITLIPGVIRVWITNPDNSTRLVDCGTFSASGSCNLPTLPSDGTYSVRIVPGSTTAAAASLWLSNDFPKSMATDGSTFKFVMDRPGLNGRLSFPALAGQNLVVSASKSSMPGQFTVYGPNGSSLGAKSFIDTQTGIHPNPQPDILNLNNVQQTGDYTLFIDPTAASTGAVEVSVTLTGNYNPGSQTVNGLIAMDGAPLAIDQTAGATGRYTFIGAVGQHVGLGFSEAVVAGGSANVSVLSPDNLTTLVNCGSYSANNGCVLPALPSTGVYTVVVTPSNAATAIKGNLTLSSDLTGTLTVGGAPVTFATGRVGQNGRYTFSATAGQSQTLNWSGATFSGNYSYFTVYAPDGSTLANSYFNKDSYPSGQLQLSNLQQTGNYTVFVDPYLGGTGQVAMQLLAPDSGTLMVDGSALAIDQDAGQTGRYTFAGTAGQYLGLGLSGVTLAPAGSYVTVVVMAPDGVTTLVNCSSFSGDNSCNLPVLPSTGTYTVVVTPNNAATTVKGNLALSSELTGTLTAGAVPTTFTTSRVGQNGRYSFSATAGQSLSLLWSGGTFSGSTNYLWVFSPDGTNLYSYPYANGSSQIQLNNLQQSGTYTVMVDPRGASIGQVSLQLQAPVGGTLAIDGSALPISVVAGGAGRYTFTGTVGQRLGLGMTGFNFAPSGGYTSVNILAPDNVTSIANCGANYAEASCNLPALPSTGTYTLVVTANNQATAFSGQLLLSSEVTGSLSAGAPALNFSTTRAGQNARYTFSANAGQSLTLTWSQSTFTGGTLRVFYPDGSQVASTSFGNTSGYVEGKLDLTNLLQSGTYTAFVDPSATSIGQIALQLLAPDSAAFAVDGNPLTISQAAGQTGRYTFSGTAGQNLGLGLSGVIMVPGNGSAYVNVLSPDGITTLAGCGSVNSSGASCNLPALPSTGTYTVVITPSASSTAITGNLTLSSDLKGPLTPGANPVTFVTDRAGQNGRYTFNVTAGQSLTLVWNGATFPASSTNYFQLYRADGSSSNSQSFSVSNPSGRLQLDNFAQTGTYTLFVDPTGSNIGQVALQLLAPDSGELTVDGNVLAIDQDAGQTGRYTFTGAAGQRLGLGASGLAFTPSGGYVSVSVLAPDGITVLINCSNFSSEGSCNLPSLPSAGSYTVVVTPSSAATAVKGNLTLSSDLTGTLTAGTATTFITARVGQNGRYAFNATAGQSLTLNWSGATFSGNYSYFTVYAPDGSTLNSQYFSKDNAPSGQLQLNNLQQTGTYTVFVDPYLGGTGQVAMQLLAPATGTLSTDGTALSVTQVAGQSGRYSFSASKGQFFKLATSGLAVSQGGSVTLSILAPDGRTMVVNCGSFSSDASCNVPALTSSGSNNVGLPSDGIYTVLIVPNGYATTVGGSLSLTPFSVRP